MQTISANKAISLCSNTVRLLFKCFLDDLITDVYILFIVIRSCIFPFASGSATLSRASNQLFDAHTGLIFLDYSKTKS